MAQEDGLSITLTTEGGKIAVCAQMMSETDPWLRYQLDYSYCLKAFDGACKEIYIMELENRVAGFAILQVCGSFKGYIQTICVHHLYRGRGYGKKLLQFCEERILKISPNIFICVSAFNKGAIKLYEEFGFIQIAELQDFLKEGISELLLRKTYGPIVGYQAIKKSV